MAKKSSPKAKGSNKSKSSTKKGKRRGRFTGMDSPVTILEREIVSLWKSKVENVWEIGKRLILLKDRLDVGHKKTKRDFKRTVEQKLPFSYSTAISYKNVAERFESPEDAALFDSKAMYALASSKYPPDLREFIIEDARKGRPYTLKDIKCAREFDGIQEAASQEEVDPESISQSEVEQAVVRVKLALLEAVNITKAIQWEEEPSPAVIKKMDEIKPIIEKLAWEFRSVPKKSNRRTFRH